LRLLRRLELVRVHERVGKTGDYYYSCTDMKDVNSGDELDLDFNISDEGKPMVKWSDRKLVTTGPWSEPNNQLQFPNI